MNKYITDDKEFKFGQLVRAIEPGKSYTNRCGHVREVAFRDANNTDSNDLRKRYRVGFDDKGNEFWLFATDLEPV